MGGSGAPDNLAEAARVARTVATHRDHPHAMGLVDRVRAAVARADAEDIVPALATIAIALGVLWRFAGLGYPNAFTFDEHHFVENARNYLARAADWNDHPPLGKLLMLPGLLIAGDNGLGWRIHEAVLGVVHIALTGAVATGIFCNRRAGWLAAAFVALDGLFVSYSRTALLDIPMNTFMMAALALMLHARHLGWFAAAAAMLGLGVAVKWIAVCLALVVPLLLRRRGRSIFHALWMGAIAVAVYAAIVALALALTRKPVSLAGMITSSIDLVKHHAAFTDWKNPVDSRWYTWFFLWKPITLFRADLPDRVVRVMSTVGNPLLWYMTTAAFVVAIVTAARAGWARVSAGQRLPRLVAQTTLTLLTAAALLVQWILTNRESYIWHYMGTYALGLVLLAGLLAAHLGRHPRALGAILLAAIGVSVFYAPVWTNMPLAHAAMVWRLPFPLWR